MRQLRESNWVTSRTFSSQYEPAAGDMVVGVVTERHAEEYRVDIGAW